VQQPDSRKASKASKANQSKMQQHLQQPDSQTAGIMSNECTGAVAGATGAVAGATAPATARLTDSGDHE